MAPEIPSQFQFGELLSHTFPGFFSAITFFMLIDVLSPFDFTLWAIKDIPSLATFVGFVVLFGTILGIIIDGIHHSIIEGIFKNFLGYKKINNSLKALYPSTDLELHPIYFFKILGDRAIDIFEFLIRTRYRYSEFNANTFISLIPFSFVAPFYLLKVLQISWIWSIFLASASFIIAVCCFHRSYASYKAFLERLFSVICGYLDYGCHVDLTAKKGNQFIDISNVKDNISLEARIVENKSKKCIVKKGIEIVFNLSEMKKECAKIIAETESDGKAKVELTSDKPGTIIFTASSDKCFPGIVSVQFKKS